MLKDKLLGVQTELDRVIRSRPLPNEGAETEIRRLRAEITDRVRDNERL